MNLTRVRSSVQRLLGSRSPHLTWTVVLEHEERHLAEPHPPEIAAGSDDEKLRALLECRHQASRTALCLSGGGIRSASFAIGVMQGLARLGVLSDFDYLSTVSGGGYAGSWLSAWLYHERHRPARAGATPLSVADQLAGAGSNAASPEPEPLRYVREYSRYLDPKIGLFSIDVWTLVATIGRNLLANWLILLPLLAAALLVPRLYYTLLDLGAQNNPALYRDRLVSASQILIGLVALCGIVALRYVIVNLPSRGPSTGTQMQFLTSCLAPTLTAAGFLTLYWAWNHELTGTRVSTAALFGSVVVIHVGVWLLWGRKSGRKPLTWLGAAVASTVFGGGLWLIEQRIFPNPLDRAWLYTATALPLVIAAVIVAGSMYVAVAAAEIDDDDYEWWSRAGAWMLVAAASWLAAGAVVFFGPPVMYAIADQLTRLKLSAAQAKALIGGVAAATGGAAARAVGPGAGKQLSRTRYIVFALAAPTFTLLALTILGWGNVALLSRLEHTALHSYPHPLGAGLDEVLLLLGLLMLLGLAMSYLVNVNKFSLHGMYRARLIRTFLGASRAAAERTPNPFTGFDAADNINMSDLRGIRPLHIVNTTLNVVSTNRLAWQDRKAESFTISALHCGSALVGYRPTVEYGQQISLGTAMTISGAAVAPNQGAQSSPALTFLLTLFNARLGAWLGNPGPAGAFTWRLRDPRLGPVPLLSEMFGRTTDNNPYVYLSDGGHFDNLGLYEMVLRRCHYIVVADAGCDASYSFDDLGNAIRKIRIDLGIPITFDQAPRMTAAGQGTASNLHCAVATIDYRAVDGAAAAQGFLLYIKPVRSGDEPMDVENYARANPGFPHEPTTDQWFGEAQFESYRALGAHSIAVIARHLNTLNNAPAAIRDLCVAAATYASGGSAAREVSDGSVRV